jgi:hypothetical protein
LTAAKTILGAAAFAIAVGVVLAIPPTASAASDVQVTAIDCLGHPRRIAIQNKGDTPQDMTGWKLLSDKPPDVESFDLSVAGTVGPGVQFYVFNGHMAPPVPEQSGGQWIYPWNYTAELDESAFVLAEDGKDFIRLVDASGWPWRQVFEMPCPGTLEIPPLQQPQTPTPPPSSPDPGTQDPGQTDGNQATDAQSGATNQNAAASGNAAGTGGTGTTTQAGNVSGQAVGGPASGVGALPLQVSGGSPFAALSLPLSFLGVIVGVGLALAGARIMRRALRRP